MHNRVLSLQVELRASSDFMFLHCLEGLYVFANTTLCVPRRRNVCFGKHNIMHNRTLCCCNFNL